MHKRLGEERFREKYQKRPADLIRDMGIEMDRPGRRGADVLQAFQFYPLPPNKSAVYENILRDYARKPVHRDALKPPGRRDISIGTTLRVLEARGLIRTKEAKIGRKRVVFISEVLDDGVWKKAVQPG